MQDREDRAVIFGLADVGSFGLTRETTCSIVPSRGITMRPLLSR